MRALEHGARLGLGLPARGDDGFGIAEPDIPELDCRNLLVGACARGVLWRTSGGGCADGCRQSRVVGILGRQIEDLLNATQRTQSLVHRGDRPEEAAEGTHEQEQEKDEGHKTCHLDRSGGYPIAAHTQDDQQRNLKGDPRDGDDKRGDLGDADPDPVRVSCDARDLGDLAFGSSGRAHGSDRTDRALDRGGQFTDLLLLLAGRATDAAAEHHDAGDGDPDHDDNGQQQQGINQRHRDEGADEDEGVAHGIRESLRQDRIEQRRVGSDTGNEVTCAPRVEFADGEVQDAGHELSPAGVDHGSSGALQQVVLEPGDDRGCHHERNDSPHQQPEAAASLDLRNHLPDQQRLGEGRDGPDDTQDGDDDQHGAVLEEERHQLAERRAWAFLGGAAPTTGGTRISARHRDLDSGRGLSTTVLRARRPRPRQAMARARICAEIVREIVDSRVADTIVVSRGRRPSPPRGVA